MKDPAKSTARDLAQKKKSLRKKFLVLWNGEVSTYPEWDACLRLRSPEGLEVSSATLKKIDPLIYEVYQAIRDGNHRFFERLTKLAKFFSQDFSKAECTDWLGVNVVVAAHHHIWDRKRMTVASVTERVNKGVLLPRRGDKVRDGGIEERQVREVMKRVGLIEWSRSWNERLRKQKATPLKGRKAR